MVFFKSRRIDQITDFADGVGISSEGVQISKDYIVNFEQLRHNLKECPVCKYGRGHGGIVEEYSRDRVASSFSIIINTVSIFTVAVCPSMPWIFSQAGWFAIFVILWIGLLTWLGCRYLIKALYSVEGHRLYDYTSLATHHFGYWAGVFARLVSHFIQICTVGVLVVSILDNFKLLINYLGYADIIEDNFNLWYLIIFRIISITKLTILYSALLAIISIAIPGYFIRNMNDATLTS
jgi:hypothetical protein